MPNKINLPSELDIKIFTTIFKKNNLDANLPGKLLEKIASLIGLDYHLRLSKKISAEVCANEICSKIRKILNDSFPLRDDFENAMYIFLSVLSDSEDDSDKKNQNIKISIASAVELNFGHLNRDQKKDLKSYLKKLFKGDKIYKLLDYIENNKELLIDMTKSKNITNHSLIDQVDKTQESLKNQLLQKNLSRLVDDNGKLIDRYASKTYGYKGSFLQKIKSDHCEIGSKSFEKNLDNKRTKEKSNISKDLRR